MDRNNKKRKLNKDTNIKNTVPDNICIRNVPDDMHSSFAANTAAPARSTPDSVTTTTSSPTNIFIRLATKNEGDGDKMKNESSPQKWQQDEDCHEQQHHAYYAQQMTRQQAQYDVLTSSTTSLDFHRPTDFTASMCSPESIASHNGLRSQLVTVTTVSATPTTSPRMKGPANDDNDNMHAEGEAAAAGFTIIGIIITIVRKNTR